MKKIFIAIFPILFSASFILAGGLESLTNYQQIASQKINLDLNNADIDDVIKIFSEKMNVNIVRNKNVDTKVTVHLKDIPVSDAFQILCRTHNLSYQANGRIIQLYNQKDMFKDGGLTAGDIRIFELKHAKAENVYKKLIEMGASDGKNDNYGASAIYMNDKLNAIYVVGRADFGNMDSLMTLIEQLDKPTPQVLIEAKILEVKLGKNSSFGIRWNTILNGAAINSPNGLTFGSGAKTSASSSFVIEDVENIGANLSISALLNALTTEGDVKTLSSPRLLCMNNEEAKIIQGNNEPYQEVVKDQFGGSLENWKFVEVGIGMTIKPVIASNMIQLTIAPEISSATREVGLDAAPTITKSQMNTVVTVRDGSTLVLGGLITSQREKDVSGIPFLSKIPLLGYLFSSHSWINNKYEIVFLITPTIVRQ